MTSPNVNNREQINKLCQYPMDYVKNKSYIFLKDKGYNTFQTILRVEFESWLVQTDKLFYVYSRSDQWGEHPIAALPLTIDEYWTLPPYTICEHLHLFNRETMPEMLGEEFRPFIEEISYQDVKNDSLPF